MMMTTTIQQQHQQRLKSKNMSHQTSMSTSSSSMRSRPLHFSNSLTYSTLDANTPSSSSSSSSSCTSSWKHPSRYRFTFRSFLTFLTLEAILSICVILAFDSVVSKHPLTLPFAIVLPILITWSIIQTLSSNPLITYNKNLNTIQQQLEQQQHVQNQDEKCQKCFAFRLARTHHCRKCHTCIPRMSHHCGVLGVCIGLHNHKSFLLILFYGIIGSLILFYFLVNDALSVLMRLLTLKDPITVRAIVWLYAIYFQFVLFIALTGLFTFHLRLATKNWTILEATVSNSLWSIICPSFPCWKRKKGRRLITDVSPFHKGSTWQNLSEIFGNSILRSFIPVVDYHTAIEKIMSETKDVHAL